MSDAPARLDLVATRPDEVDAAFDAVYGPTARGSHGDGDAVSFDLRGAMVPGLSAVQMSIGGEFRARYEPTGSFFVALIEDGHYDVEFTGGALSLGGGGALLFDEEAPVQAMADSLRVTTIELDLGEVRRATEQVAPWHRGGPLLGYRRPLTPDLEAVWARSTQYVRHSLESSDLLGESDLLRASVQHHLASTAVAVFGLAPDGDERTAPSAAARRAQRYMDDHAGEPITVGDVAEAAGLSVRGLHNTFRRSFGTSPLVYLRRVRLDAARRELQRSEPGGVTVAEVSRRWGFAHPGRFAIRYAEEYGESPSRTLGG